MLLHIRRRYDSFLLWLIVLVIVSGCSGRRISSGMDDQVFISRSSSAHVQDAARVASPDRLEEAEIRVSEQPVESKYNPGSSPRQQMSTLTDVYFDFGEYTIRNDARSKLTALATTLKAQSNSSIIVEGHCDERGTNAYNLILGERRAHAVKRHLQNLGVASSQLKVVSHGKERPVCTEHSDACRQLNRRVHFSWP
jgi:peptidoglycan-associated lipoprotein